MEDILHEEAQEENKDMVGAVLEFRGACGGQESQLFAEEMKDYMENFLRSKGFAGVSSSNDGKTIRLKVSGREIYNYIRFEAGVHKVIRVPQTESRGRLHSSTMTLMILPEMPFNFDLDQKQLRFEYMRSQGSGGQHVNTTDSACRVTHIPSGLAVVIQDSRNQHENKARALEVIREKVFQHEFEKKREKDLANRRSQVSTGDRSEKIRTYNFQQDRITDHRLQKTVFGINEYLGGGVIFEECIEEMKDLELKQRREELMQTLIDLAK